MTKRREFSYRRRRRRGLRRPVFGLVVALVAVLAVAAAVMAASTGTQGPSGSSAPRATSGPRHHVRHARSAATGAAAVAAVLRYTPFVASGSMRKRAIALTFDDGPSPYTPQIVRLLVRMRVPATFFVVGQQLRYFSFALRAEVRHGFEIGDHTENHAWMITLGAAAQRAQIVDAAAGVRRYGAAAPRLFRPPYGMYDGRTLAALRRLGMLMVMWSIDPGDWRRPGRKAIVQNVLTHAKPGAIVILHDGGGDRSETVAALPTIISALRRRGYALVTVSQLVKADPPPRHQALPHLGAA